MYINKQLDVRAVPHEGIGKNKIDNIPLGIGITETRYVDPFVGAGKMFFSVMSRYNMESAVIYDPNPEVRNFYRQLKSNPCEMLDFYEKYENELEERDFAERQKYMRVCLRRLDYALSGSEEQKLTRRATLFCFAKNYHYLLETHVDSGIIRNNGVLLTPRFCGSKPLSALADIMSKTTVADGDFTECLNYVNGEAVVRIASPSDCSVSKEAVYSFRQIAEGLNARLIED